MVTQKNYKALRERMPPQNSKDVLTFGWNY